MASQISRSVIKKVLAIETPEGAGARVRRSIGTPALRNYTPFLMLDHFTIPRGAGFPDHPHRGQATFTYVIKGNTKHEDSKGHKGTLTEGGIQLMTAGKGVIHAEMPFWPTPDAPDPVGMQLWIDIPKDKKMMEPDYQEYSADQLPVARPFPSTTIKVLSGKSYGEESPVVPQGGCWYLHIQVDKANPEEAIFQEIPVGWTTFIYTMAGSIKVGDDPTVYPEFHTLVLTGDKEQNGIKISAVSDNTDYIVVAGMPLEQDVVQYGPFVMTSRAEIQQALMDYNYGRNGFEEAHSWTSEIGNV
ncbi:RmlC-like cupin domain-containing protein [Flagelloscypha sp. PMI_526]|nr:RmlC-like cupin domain-containing protein [Flagelloscypha sp. PMI_526]